jgi:hypothetical protein
LKKEDAGLFVVFEHKNMQALIEDDKGLDVEALLSDIERLRRCYFFALGSQIRQAQSLATINNGVAPDLSRLYEEYSDVPDDKWRSRLIVAFGGKDEN